MPRDLVRLRDVGYPDPILMGGPSPLAVSPDGRRVAFVINQADPDSNSYCRALVVVPIAAASAPQIIDRGGELITITDVQRGMFVRGGFPAVVTPVWSPDGHWVAYLKRVEGSTQVWRARADGSGAESVTKAPADVEAAAWSGNGRIIYTTRPAKEAIGKAIDREGRSGWLYDERVVTFSGARPQIREADAPLVAFSVDPETGATTRASAQDARTVGGGVAALLSGDLAASARDGRRAWVEPRGLSSSSDSDLSVSDGAGGTTVCAPAICHGGIVGLWWMGDGQELLFLRRQGWNKGEMALYRWKPGTAEPRPVLVTPDALIGCVPAGERLVCIRENATTPRRVVTIDAASGRSTLLLDLNPEFANIDLGHVERLEWRNSRGLEAWGDLVVPPGAAPGKKLPLIVVQYSSRGFLRGGTGDEYPIFALAARGFAVLSFERPSFVASLDPAIKDWTAFAAANQRDWADRRSLLSAIETGVRMVVARGIADPARIGITGLSDGATTVRFALINSKMFSAASISTCCLEPWTVNTYAGIAFAEFVRSVGYPSLIRPDPDFWRPMSIAQNAARIDTPLLMQLDDDDGYLLALEAFESLREYGKPVEMYVFPGEFHAKWQPVHRLAIYERNLDWFDFWLRGTEDPQPAKAAQYARWRLLRERARRATVNDRRD
ncbi:MAG TPA: Atxe2 family lasso peptide isopeptidase [Allosphingosinicella sp.]|nr:Atxe2 family lasso peptide isopeptidase [Allosphingosinicella sp.]